MWAGKKLTVLLLAAALLLPAGCARQGALSEPNADSSLPDAGYTSSGGEDSPVVPDGTTTSEQTNAGSTGGAATKATTGDNEQPWDGPAASVSGTTTDQSMVGAATTGSPAQPGSTTAGTSVPTQGANAGKPVTTVTYGEYGPIVKP